MKSPHLAASLLLATALAVSAVAAPAGAIARSIEVVVATPDGPVTLRGSTTGASRIEARIERPYGPPHVYTADFDAFEVAAAVGDERVLTCRRSSATAPASFDAGGERFDLSSPDAAHGARRSPGVDRVRALLSDDMLVFAAARERFPAGAFFALIYALATGDEPARDPSADGYAAAPIGPVEPEGAPEMGCYWNCRFWTGLACECWLGCGGTRDAMGSPCSRTGTR